MTSAEATIFDVGHGNCALIVDDDSSVVIDTPHRNVQLRDTLAAKADGEGKARLTAVLISHAHKDHIGGLLGLLTNPSVAIERIYMNPGIERETELWTDLLTALKDARLRGEVAVEPSLTSSTVVETNAPRLTYEVLSPTPENAIGGLGGSSERGHKQTANGLSAVIRIQDTDSRGILFAADMDGHAFDALVDSGADLTADVLVFPHHGGRPGSVDPEAFAYELSRRVEPNAVIFSMARARGKYPRPDIIAGVRRGAPSARIACTQLSSHCSETAPVAQQPYLSTLPASGKPNGLCCAGTIKYLFSAEDPTSGLLDRHGDFVRRSVPQAMCRPPAPTAT